MIEEFYVVICKEQDFIYTSTRIWIERNLLGIWCVFSGTTVWRKILRSSPNGASSKLRQALNSVIKSLHKDRKLFLLQDFEKSMTASFDSFSISTVYFKKLTLPTIITFSSLEVFQKFLKTSKACNTLLSKVSETVLESWDSLGRVS